jgi:acyl carrier protein
MGTGELKPTRKDILLRIAELFSEVTGLPSDGIGESSTFESDLKLESVKFVELHVAIEEEFDIELDPVELVELNDLGTISTYLYSIIQEGRA